MSDNREDKSCPRCRSKSTYRVQRNTIERQLMGAKKYRCMVCSRRFYRGTPELLASLSGRSKSNHLC